MNYYKTGIRKLNRSFFLLFFLCISTIHSKEFKLGIENIPHNFTHYFHRTKRDCHFALITNQTGLDQRKRRTVDVLRAQGYIVSYICAPEHGFTGVIKAGNTVNNAVDSKTGIPIISLYENGTGKTVNSAILNTIDVLLYDLQDSGMRHYTYISSLFKAMEAATTHNIPFVVFDRPNPLGGTMEGPLVAQNLISFISIAPIPVRHGMTTGELARYFNNTLLKKQVQLHVVPMKGYNRFDQTQFSLFAPLSPNLAAIQSVYGYSFLGLLGEIAPFDVGVGTPYAFQIITLEQNKNVPKNMWQKLQKLLYQYNIKSRFHTYIKNKKTFHGLRLYIENITTVDSFQLLLALLYFFQKSGIDLQFSSSFNKAMGTGEIQKIIKTGKAFQPSFLNTIENDLLQFYNNAKKFFIYQPISIIYSL